MLWRKHAVDHCSDRLEASIVSRHECVLARLAQDLHNVAAAFAETPSEFASSHRKIYDCRQLQQGAQAGGLLVDPHGQTMRFSKFVPDGIVFESQATRGSPAAKVHGQSCRRDQALHASQVLTGCKVLCTCGRWSFHRFIAWAGHA